ncbi:MAG: hypothetical protein AAGI71_16060 [Bacteroidota bacterium]
MIPPLSTRGLVGALLLGCLTLAAASQAARLTYFRVEKEQNDLVITWQAADEANVQGYVLERRSPFTNGTFKKIDTSFLPHGIGKPYRYRDDEVYKASSDEVEYRLYALSVSPAGERTLLAQQKVNYTATTIRRTWGSIKAMFQ